MSSHLKSISSSKHFKSQYDRLAVSASISGSYGGLSAAASASYEGVTDSASSGEDYKELIKTDITEFQTDVYQIIREIATTVSINGVTATEHDSK